MPTSASDPAVVIMRSRGGDVVFDEHRDAMQRAARAFGFALSSSAVGDGERVRIEFDNRVDGGAVLVDVRFSYFPFIYFKDARRVPLDERASGELARFHALLQLGQRDFFELERLSGVCKRVRLRRISGRGRDSATCGQSRSNGGQRCGSSTHEGSLKKRAAGVLLFVRHEVKYSRSLRKGLGGGRG